jgi:hypothetical protein
MHAPSGGWGRRGEGNMAHAPQQCAGAHTSALTPAAALRRCHNAAVHHTPNAGAPQAFTPSALHGRQTIRCVRAGWRHGKHIIRALWQVRGSEVQRCRREECPPYRATHATPHAVPSPAVRERRQQSVRPRCGEARAAG